MYSNCKQSYVPMVHHSARSRTHHTHHTHHTHNKRKNNTNQVKLNVNFTMTRESLKNKLWDMLVKKLAISIYVSSSPTLTESDGHVYKNYNHLLPRCEDIKYPGAPIFTQYRADDFVKSIIFDVHGCVIDYADMYVFVVSQNNKNEISDILLVHSP